MCSSRDFFVSLIMNTAVPSLEVSEQKTGSLHPSGHQQETFLTLPGHSLQMPTLYEQTIQQIYRTHSLNITS